MPTLDDLSKNERERNLYFAVIEHFRTWLASDWAFRAQIETYGFSPALLRSIGGVFKVGRGIPCPTRAWAGAVLPDDIHAQWLVDELVKLANDPAWQGDLNARADHCIQIALKGEQTAPPHLRYQAVSAISKFMWFLAPEGWTLFDNVAATGLGFPNSPGRRAMQAYHARHSELGGPDDRERGRASCMRLFYESLVTRRFTKWSATINGSIAATMFQHLYGERVIDKFLMLCGAKDNWRVEVVEKPCGVFLNTCNNKTRDQLDRLAQDISQNFATDLLNT